MCVVMQAALAGCAAKPVVRVSPDEQYKHVADNLTTMVTGGRVSQIRWSDDGIHVTYQRGDKNYQCDLTTFEVTEVQREAAAASSQRGERASRPARGRQRDRVSSPDGKWVAVCKDWNVVIEPSEQMVDEDQDTESTEIHPSDETDTTPIQVTTDGHRKHRYGSASWVYGEELGQRDGMWWSPDSTKLVFYAFDERSVPDHFITADLTKLHTRVLTEGYPKPGEPNPIANLLVYDLNTKSTVWVQAPTEDDEWYTYGARFTPSKESPELIFFRTNRRQNILQLTAANLETGETRIILSERQDTWQDNSPTIHFLEDGKQFIWETEKTGWKQYELRDVDGSLLSVLTAGQYPVASIVRVDEAAGVLYYMAYSDSNPLNAHLHRVNLDGSNQQRLTQDSLNHTVASSGIAPDGKWFIAEAQSVDSPPKTVLSDTTGRVVATIAESDTSKFQEFGMELPELFTFKADDGVTDLYGVLYKPSHFDPKQKYPLLIDVYGGPLSQGVPNRFSPGRAECEYGLLIAEIDNRGTVNRGKAFETAAYLRLGDVDIKDQADGVKFLSQRPYVDSSRVGIMGHSYGGYMSALAVLKYPDVFHVAAAGGTVADWRQYDTIYTERFMRTPQENQQGYDNGSCLTYVDQFKGKLLLLHGMVDDNVHANNAWQLADALHKANKQFEMMFFPEAGHSLGATASRYRWQFLRRHLLNQ